MPSSVNFVTVPLELQPIAYACCDALRAAGFSLKHEHNEDHFPETATIYARRGGEEHFYVFDPRIKIDRAALWAGYGRSCSSTTFVVICVPADIEMNGSDMVRIRELGVGLTAIDRTGALSELVAPVDLSLNIALPPLNRHRASIKRELAKVHEHFGRGDWRRGFEHACKIVEKSARRYLARQVRANQVQVPGRHGHPRRVTLREVQRMPLGALADVFCTKLIQHPVDSHLCSGLKRINPDRIDVAHEIRSRRKERRLRGNVGRHMWTIDNLLKKIPV